MGIVARRPAAGFWRTVWLLLAVSYKRAVGRQRRQRELFRQRAATQSDFSGLFFGVGAVALALLHVMVAYMIADAIASGQQVEAEQHGLMVVDQRFIDAVSYQSHRVLFHPKRALHHICHVESAQIAQREGGDRLGIEAKLQRSVQDHGTASFVSYARAVPGLAGLPQSGHLAGLLGALTLLTWFVMLSFQGEGLELDTQRRRHPMWEWLFSHPVSQGAVFLAEMLAPLAANPVYFGAPLLPGFLYGFIYGMPSGLLAGTVVGIPVTIAAACLGKALEVAVTLRCTPRSRGALIGIMGWLGYATMLVLFLAALNGTKILIPLARLLGPVAASGPVAAAHGPFLGWFLGALPDGTFSLPVGIAVDVLSSILVITASVGFSVWGAGRGLVGNPDAGFAPRGQKLRPSAVFGRDALYRKELLWFVRDRSALVQALLIPISVAALQAFNLRGLLAHAGQQWNTLCGMGVVFGTYFLIVLGPKSLASEGGALWMALTWPHGLEKLLKAKARLWTLLATAIVSLVLVFAAVRFPADAWRVALIGLAWFLFARSLAAKSVTLATVTSESGEVKKVPRGRSWAAQLGVLTFSVGVFTQQWNLVVLGVVYSAVTAAAMWQNFRARLPYLYDSWSEVLPTPPTLMHAMIGISLLVEIGAGITAALLGFLPREDVAVAQAVVYGLCAGAVSLGMAMFLDGRGVKPAVVWNWRDASLEKAASPGWRNMRWLGDFGLPSSLLLGVALGAFLAGGAHLYLVVVRTLPEAAEQMQHAAVMMKSVPHLPEALFIMAVFIAPFAEEFLFRGLLYRALDREWGGWRAIIGSAAFFAVYHPMLSWPPVFLLGVVNALLFRKTGRLASAVALHMTYNAVVMA